MNPSLRLGIWLKVMLTAQINNKIGEAVRHTLAQIPVSVRICGEKGKQNKTKNKIKANTYKSTYSCACWLPDDCQLADDCWIELCWTLELCCWKPEDIWKAALEECCMLDSVWKIVTVGWLSAGFYSRCSKLELDWLKLELDACWLMELLCMLDSE